MDGLKRWKLKTAVVTGAASGNGSAIVKEMLKNDIVVIGIDKNFDALLNFHNSIQNNNFYIKPCDVSDSDNVRETFDSIIKEHKNIDILINNAGIAREGNLCSMNPKDVENVLNTNVLGYINCIRETYNNMKSRNFDGHIIMINSAFGHRIVPIDNNTSVNIYGPAKYAVTAMTETYRQEFFKERTKIKITSISPGLVKTPMIDENIRNTAENILYPEDIANAVLYALSTPPHVQIHEISLKPFGEPV